MQTKRKYEVWLLPLMEVAERHCTLAEADAWMRSYNAAARGPTLAVVAQGRAEEELVATNGTNGA